MIAFRLTLRKIPQSPSRARYRRSQSTSPLAPRHPPPPPEIAQWFAHIAAQPTQVVSEQIDALRSRQLQATLPTRLTLSDTHGPLSLQPAGAGEELPKGHHLAYFQPEGLLSDLAEDGSSTVCQLILDPALLENCIWL